MNSMNGHKWDLFEQGGQSWIVTLQVGSWLLRSQLCLLTRNLGQVVGVKGWLAVQINIQYFFGQSNSKQAVLRRLTIHNINAYQIQT